MENLEKNNDLVLDGVNVGALRSLDECLLRGEKAFAKAEAGAKLTKEEKDLCDFYHKLKLIAQVWGISEGTSENNSKTNLSSIKKELNSNSFLEK